MKANMLSFSPLLTQNVTFWKNKVAAKVIKTSL